MSIANFLNRNTNAPSIDIKETSTDFSVGRNLYVGNDIINQKLLDRIQTIENDIASIKSTLSSISTSTDLVEIKQTLADILEVLNPQS
jgi:hypothetical protein